MPLILLGAAAVALTGGGLWAAGEGADSLANTAIKLTVVAGVVFVGGRYVLKVW